MVASNNLRMLRCVSNLYSSAAFKRLLADENLGSVGSILEKFRATIPSHKTETFIDIMSAAYESMCKNYCNEYIFKNFIFSSLIKKYSLKFTSIHSELKIGKSVADLVLVNGEVKVFEIKTELDNLSKLDLQLSDYKRVAGKINLVVSQKHLSQVDKQFGDSAIGIILLDEKQRLITIKEAEVDEKNFDFFVLFRLLRKSEYIAILKEELGVVLNVPNTIIFKEAEKALSTIDLIEFQRLVFAKIKARKIKEPGLLMDNRIPKEMKFLLHCLDLNANGYENFFALLNQKV